MIGIRVDANSIIATGHIMRCITIARAIVRNGGSVTFFIADEESALLLRKNAGELSDTNVVILNSIWDDMESELPVLIEQIQLREIDMLLVDSYKVTYDYFKAISRVCRTAYIDDLHEGIFPVDILINYSGYHDMFDYTSDYANMRGHGETTTRLLLGLMYAPLREQFALDVGSYGTDVGGHGIKDILLACGGGDTLGMILPMMEVIADRGLVGSVADDSSVSKNEVEACKSGLIWHVVVGDYVENKEEIRAFASLHKGFVIHESVQDMASLMRSCDLAVVAAGTMLTECAAIRLPAVFYQVADNQKYGVQYWSGPDRMIYAGDATIDKSGVIASVIREVTSLMNDQNRLANIQDKLASIMDGHGAERIAEALLDRN